MATIRKSVESLATPGILRRRTGAEAEKLERPLEPGVASVQAIGYGKFALATVGACLALLTATLLMNVLVDPFAIAGTGLLPTAVEADRTVKLDLIRKLERSPDIVILGSSRARPAAPEVPPGARSLAAELDLAPRRRRAGPPAAKAEHEPGALSVLRADARLHERARGPPGDRPQPDPAQGPRRAAQARLR